jgi:sugar phosphate isomerase/epimerase
MRLSLSEISTANASFDEDVLAYARAGFEGIGVWEYKLSGDNRADVDALRAAGLAVTNCMPLNPTFLPNEVIPGPDDPDERIESIRASIFRFAAFAPTSVVCITGPVGRFGEAEARRIVVEGLEAADEAAKECGVTLGLEPIHPSQRDAVSFVNTVAETLELLDEAGVAGSVGIFVDTFNLADDETASEHLERHADRVTGLHVADHSPDAAQGRALPGEGRGRTRELVDTLRGAGWDGWVDVEIFSTPDGFWGLPPDEAARRAFAAARRLVASERPT